MRTALRGLPVKPLVQPPGMVTVRIDPETGLLAGADLPDAIFETFRVEHVPERHAPESGQSSIEGITSDLTSEEPGDSTVSEELF